MFIALLILFKFFSAYKRERAILRSYFFLFPIVGTSERMSTFVIQVMLSWIKISSAERDVPSLTGVHTLVGRTDRRWSFWNSVLRISVLWRSLPRRGLLANWHSSFAWDDVGCERAGLTFASSFEREIGGIRVKWSPAATVGSTLPISLLLAPLYPVLLLLSLLPIPLSGGLF